MKLRNYWKQGKMNYISGPLLSGRYTSSDSCANYIMEIIDNY